jgi:hypothetical protein
MSIFRASKTARFMIWLSPRQDLQCVSLTPPQLKRCICCLHNYIAGVSIRQIPLVSEAFMSCVLRLRCWLRLWTIQFPKNL